MAELSLLVRIGDDAEMLALVPAASEKHTEQDQRLVLAAYLIRGMQGLRSRRSQVARMGQDVIAVIHETHPRTVVMTFEGAHRDSRRHVDRIARQVTRQVSVTATNAIGSETTVIGLVIMTGSERDLAATCVRRVALQPPLRGDGLVFHAADLRRAGIYELIEEAVS